MCSNAESVNSILNAVALPEEAHHLGNFKMKKWRTKSRRKREKMQFQQAEIACSYFRLRQS